jgi:hypothetical protein
MGGIVRSNETIYSSTPMENGSYIIGDYDVRDHK